MMTMVNSDTTHNNNQMNITQSLREQEAAEAKVLARLCEKQHEQEAAEAKVLARLHEKQREQEAAEAKSISPVT